MLNKLLWRKSELEELKIQYLNMNKKLDKVTIKAYMPELFEEGQWEDLVKKEEKDKQQKIEYGFIVTKLLNDSIHIKKADGIINEVKALLAGFVAEEMLLGSCGFSCHARDHELAYKILEQLVFEGIDPKLVAKNVSEELKQKAFKLLQQCKQEVKQLLNDHLDALRNVTEELLIKRILTNKEIQTIIDKAEGRIVATEEVTTETTDIQTTDELTPAPAE